MIKVESSGNWDKTRAWANRIIHRDLYDDLDRYGKLGVLALSEATPVETGVTASSWYYVIKTHGKRPRIEWHNNHLDENGVTPIVILLQYGHGTGTGGYVQGRDFINPALRPIFDDIADDIWRKVTE